MNLLEWFIDLYIGIALIVVNIYFLVFVHYKSDLAPNFALGIVTIPFGIYNIVKCLGKQPKKKITEGKTK